MVDLADVVVASNRGPLAFRRDEAGALEPAPPGGGLAGSLRDLLEGSGATWVSCALSEADRAAQDAGLLSLPDLRLRTVAPDETTYDLAYDLVSNATLWFCHHHLFDLTRRPRFDQRWPEAWAAYRRLNRLIADEVAASAPGDGVVLVQDYHLALAPRLVRQARPDLRVVHFSHTPFADPGVLRVLPADCRRELLAGMAGGTCGFHTRRWAQAFEACCRDQGLDPPRTFASPLAPDPEKLLARVRSAACQEAGERLLARTGERALVVRTDRVELSKNVIRGFWAIDLLLELRPELRDRFVHLAFVYPSRQRLPEYLAYRAELEQTAAAVNERWARGDWQPIVVDVRDDPDRSLAALRLADVVLVNPVRDGLNLVAKEAPLVSERQASLVLSAEAGAAEELAEAAFVVNPFDVLQTATALADALTLSPAERQRRAERLRALVLAHPPRAWLDAQLAAAEG
ncbi:trehalose-6-phosphate synthase [Aciditerrimonas ferrireducens]|uniref:Trehalose-6-phosphate synthase n=1 Tax=Aciditerrimonas ferrireducens TaxID=667306 RepID=A0ABV6C9N0_9ACTN